MISIKSGKKSFGNRQVLKNINLSINKGDFISIVGKSGSGKSTLLSILGLLDHLDEGCQLFEGHNIREMDDFNLSKIRSNSIGFIFQFYHLIPKLTAEENILMPSIFRYKKDYDRVLFSNLVHELEIEDILLKPVDVLSGGEKQRVSIVRALLGKPNILICDEPTGNLDDENSEIIKELLIKKNKEGITIVLVTHDYQMSKIASRAYLLEDGELDEV